VLHGYSSSPSTSTSWYSPGEVGGLALSVPPTGWSNILIPDKHALITDAGKILPQKTSAGSQAQMSCSAQEESPQRRKFNLKGEKIN
jgi:hypothetical protein